MMKKVRLVLTIFLLLNITNVLFAENNFFEKGKKKYLEEKYNDSKFLFQKSIVFNPKNTNSYLYLAKIYNIEENKKEKEKNINTVLLLDPKNEEAIYMLMEIELEKSNYSQVKDLAKTFTKVCKKLCKKKDLIFELLKSQEPKNDS